MGGEAERRAGGERRREGKCGHTAQVGTGCQPRIVRFVYVHINCEFLSVCLWCTPSPRPKKKKKRGKKKQTPPPLYTCTARDLITPPSPYGSCSLCLGTSVWPPAAQVRSHSVARFSIAACPHSQCPSRFLAPSSAFPTGPPRP